MTGPVDISPPSARELAFDFLLRIERGGAYIDRILASPAARRLDARDQAFLRELVMGVERWKLRLDRIIDFYYIGKSRSGNSRSLDDGARTAIRLGLAQLVVLNGVPEFAAVNESVGIARARYGAGVAGVVNAVLRRFIREGEPPVTTSDPVARIAVEHSFPEWLARRWFDRFGPETAGKLVAATSVRHPVTIRANRLRTDAARLASELGECGISAEAMASSPGFLTIQSAAGLFETAAFREGRFTIQDAAAGMASTLLDPRPGETVLDCCAAPGGKTTHIAELMGDKGVVDSLDRHPGRLKLVTESAARLGLTSVRTFAGDAVAFAEESAGRYDRVLCDVPCTGTGVFAKRPDMKWRRTADDIHRMAETQQSILAAAFEMVKPGGVVVYSTCTLEPEENEAVVASIVDRGVAVVETDDRFATNTGNTGSLILPHLMGGSGAFAAKLRRNS